ncbi:MAG TPA: hypothetical protein VGP37_12400 [Candidatus Nanopelagicales bacterium]|nr:hypothetical protein [Candidatus Nanopelagicales bacterium]
MSDDLRTNIWTKLYEDPDFRDQLKTDPRTALAALVGEEPPSDVEIVVVENGPKTFHIVLPPSDISIEEMDATVGGFGGWADVILQPMF